METALKFSSLKYGEPQTSYRRATEKLQLVHVRYGLMMPLLVVLGAKAGVPEAA